VAGKPLGCGWRYAGPSKSGDKRRPLPVEIDNPALIIL
jgi:hypothetical protein